MVFEGVHLDDFIIGLAGRAKWRSMHLPTPRSCRSTQQSPPTRSCKDLISSNCEAYRVRGASAGNQCWQHARSDQCDLAVATFGRRRLATLQRSQRTSGRYDFTVSDGTRSVTIELDDLNDSLAPRPGNVPLTYSNRVPTANPLVFRSETAIEIATRFSDLVNSSIVQSVLDINAILVNGNSPSGSSTVA